jgi:hypothetical protein
MNDMRAVIVPKSDQMNADDLIGGPRTITIREVTIRPGTEQPVSMFFDGDNGKPFKPCKSMARVMVHCWGADANAYVGRSMTLYRDPAVKWGGMAVGGIRISHMSDIKAAQTMALTETKGKRTPFVVKPLVVEAPKQQTQRAPTLNKWIEGLRADLDASDTVEAVESIANEEGVLDALKNGPAAMKAQINGMIAAALDRVNTPASDPGDTGIEEV